MGNTNNNEKRKLFVYTIIISIITAISVFLPLFFGISGSEAVPNRIDFGITNMLLHIDQTTFTYYDFMICMVIAGWPTLAFGLASVAIAIATFVKNDDNQIKVYKKLNIGCLVLSLTYSLFGIIDMIVGFFMDGYVVPLNWIYSIPVVVLFIGFMRNSADCAAGERVEPSKKSKIAVLSTIIASSVIVLLSIGLSLGLGNGSEKTIVKDGIIYKMGDSGKSSYSFGYERGYIAVGADNVTAETLIIPNTINGLRVIGIGEHAFEYAPCKEILLPGSIYSIDEYAFKGCPNLEKIVAPVHTIQQSAFEDCMSLETVVTSAYEIGDAAFFNCTNLKSVICNNSKTIGNSAFAGCTSLADFNFSASLESIGARAFESTAITSLTLTNAKTIGYGAFGNCDSLATVDLGSVNTIGGRAFFGCDNLVSVSIGGVSKIQEEAFSDCRKLNSITYVNYSASSSSDMVIVLPTSVTDISDIEGTIYYMGSKENWANVQKNNYTNKVYYYSYNNPYESNPESEDLYWHDVNGVPVVWDKPSQETN